MIKPISEKTKDHILSKAEKYANKYAKQLGLDVSIIAKPQSPFRLTLGGIRLIPIGDRIRTRVFLVEITSFADMHNINENKTEKILKHVAAHEIAHLKQSSKMNIVTYLLKSHRAKERYANEVAESLTGISVEETIDLYEYMYEKLKKKGIPTAYEIKAIQEKYKRLHKVQ